MKQNSQYSALFNVLKFSRPSTSLLVATLLLTLLSSGVELLVPIQTKYLVDDLSQGQSIWGATLAILVFLMIFSALTQGVLQYILGKLGNRQNQALRSKLIHHIYSLKVPFFDKQASGGLSNRILSDTSVINSLVSDHLYLFISGITMLVASMVILWVIDWQLAGVLFLSVLISFLVIAPIASKLTGVSKSLQDGEASLIARLSERFSLIRMVKSHNAAHKESQDGSALVDDIYQAEMKQTVLQSLMSPFVSISLTGAIVVILTFGAARVAEGALTLGSLVAFIMYLFNVVMPLMQLSMFYSGLNKAAGAAQRVGELLEQSKEEQGIKTPVPGDIDIRNLNFSYEEATPLFDSFSAQFPKNKTTALVGESGSGKSTLFSLCLGFYPMATSHIKIGEDNVSELDLEALRTQIGYVPQEPSIVSGSIRDNLIYGLKENPNEDSLWQVLEQVKLADYVNKQPHKLDSEVGERGGQLSGGQKQRLAIARMLLRSPQIVLLDEATANLDPNTEFEVKQALNTLTKDKTTIIAAHKMSTVVEADTILVLKDHQVVASGTHSQLMESSAYYKDLIDKQMIHQEVQELQSA